MGKTQTAPATPEATTPPQAQQAVQAPNPQLDAIQRQLDALPGRMAQQSGVKALMADQTALFDTVDKATTAEAAAPAEAILESLGLQNRRVHRYGMNWFAAMKDWGMNSQGFFPTAINVSGTLANAYATTRTIIKDGLSLISWLRS